jgi:hypothetical protein
MRMDASAVKPHLPIQRSRRIAAQQPWERPGRGITACRSSRDLEVVFARPSFHIFDCERSEIP